MKIYTRTGDEGLTGLLGPTRLHKDDPRIEAYGTVDELNALLGVVRAHGLDSIDPRFDPWLCRIQEELFLVGSALADPNPQGRFQALIGPDHVERLEHLIDEVEATLPPLTSFILPGGTPTAARLHLARTVCRRAERRVVTLARIPGQHVTPALLVYLNRLGDLLFVLARLVNHRGNTPDVLWNGPG